MQLRHMPRNQKVLYQWPHKLCQRHTGGLVFEPELRSWQFHGRKKKCCYFSERKSSIRQVLSKALLSDPRRPEPDDNVGVTHHVKHRYFPPIVDTIPLVEAWVSPQILKRTQLWQIFDGFWFPAVVSLRRLYWSEMFAICYSDKSIPALESTLADEAEDLMNLETFIKKQVNEEKKIIDKVTEERKESPYPNPQTDCRAPQWVFPFWWWKSPEQIWASLTSWEEIFNWRHLDWHLNVLLLTRMVHDFHTARLFLSHYGFLSLEALKVRTIWFDNWKPQLKELIVNCFWAALSVSLHDKQFQDLHTSSVPASLLRLDSTDYGFQDDLAQLDAIPCRTADTIHLFYVKKGQKMPFEILSNVVGKLSFNLNFLIPELSLPKLKIRPSTNYSEWCCRPRRKMLTRYFWSSSDHLVGQWMSRSTRVGLETQGQVGR